MTPDEYCQERTAQSGSSFTASFRFLPPERRRAITAFYAFCREVDDVVDETPDRTQAAAQLAWWREEVERIASGHPEHPVGQALQPVCRQFSLPKGHLLEIINGMEMDLKQCRYADFEELRLYCYRVASVVGLVAAEIFGMQDPQRTRQYALDLGMAFQLTNIIRDVGEDAQRGRIYLPLNELEQFGVSTDDLLAGRASEAFIALMRFQVDRAEGYYTKALSELPAIDRKAQRPGLVMAAVYHAVLKKIQQENFRVLDQRVSLSSLHKLWLAWKTWVTA
ncbi:MAG: All-trans-phytoene synthase [Betaproteobacteria bacterium ADurb.Bin341]|nr:MAG: All-trans-phytoene synthase [Betaproteobacteria bacterium ADurb.Bin341]